MSWADDIHAKIDRISSDRVLFHATTGTMLQVSERIWGRGELTSGGKINYSEDYEVYIHKPPFPRVGSQRGKPYDMWKRPPGNLKGDARKVKGGWYPTYLAAKDAVGRKDLFFELTGDLRQDWFGGVQPRPDEVNSLLCEIRLNGKNKQKADGLSTSKGEFLTLNETEIQDHGDRIADIWRDVLNS